MMIYLWKDPTYRLSCGIGVYARGCSPDRFLLLGGRGLRGDEFGGCKLYLRLSSLDLPDDSFVSTLCQLSYPAYIFSADEVCYFDTFMAEKIKINAEDLKLLKIKLGITGKDMDQPPRLLTDQQLAILAESGCPAFSRIPIITFKAMKKKVSQFDCLPNNSGVPLVNERVKAIIERLAQDEIQFFKAKIICKDGELAGYYLLNAIHATDKIDLVRSDYDKIMMSETAYRYDFRYLTYQPDCMGSYHFVRDIETLHLLVNDEVKTVFEQEKVTGVRFERPEEYYRPITTADLVD